MTIPKAGSPNSVKPRFLEAASNHFPELPLRAACVAHWIESYCIQTKGANRGAPFVLLPWQIEALAEIYPGIPYEERIITRVLLSMARKNGKSEFCSTLVLVHLAGPEAGSNVEVVCAAAATKSQASIVFTGAEKMARGNPRLARSFTFRADRLIYALDRRDNVAFPISTNTAGAQGLRPDFFVYDEIAEAKDRELLEALDYAQTDQKIGGLGIFISTRSTNKASIFSNIDEDISAYKAAGIGGNWYRKIFSADPKADNIYAWDQVVAANPSMGYILSPEALKRDLEQTKRSLTKRPGFRARRLNIDSGGESSLVDPQDWKDAAMPIEPREELYQRMKGERAVLGIDLGSTTSMTALAIYWPDKGIVSAVNWMAAMKVEDNELLHRMPYAQWAEAGRLLLAESEIDGGMTYEPIADHVIRCFEDFRIIGFRYDGWNIKRLFKMLADRGLHYERYPLKRVLDKFVQAESQQGEAIKEFEDMLLAKPPRLRHDNDPVTNLAVNVCQVEFSDKASKPLPKLAKNTTRYPNDAAVAIIMAIADRGLYSKPREMTDEELEREFSGEAASEDEAGADADAYLRDLWGD